MKILHVASFDGNIGDNASHIGFRNIFSELLGGDFTVHQLEIRKFYNNYSLPDKQRFDEDFAKLANGYDLLFIGGGGFLDFDIKGSVTGTTIGMPPEVLDKLSVPVIISSIGSNPRNEIPEGNIEKYRAFLDAFLSKSNRYLAVRNDGSRQVIKEVIGEKYYQAIPEVLDHGFFYTNDGSFYKPTEREYILINTTSDQVQMKNRNIGTVNADNYIDEMGKVINHIINDTAYDLVFAPHIYSDFAAINSLVKNVNDFHMRTRVVITPYVQGNFGANQIFSAYKNSAIALGMRFHANVCTIAMNSVGIGLGALDRVAAMYNSMELNEQYVTVDKPFGDELISKIHGSIKSGDTGAEVLAQRQAETKAYYKQILQNV
ncbi:MAG: polysaccharide pyruvyl transferase family protein [Sphingobacteriaceae bacterium]|nr:MAG: polysaccharide pyruvyl transferase family protein [Sphingobacteriaceae bacterium]